MIEKRLSDGIYVNLRVINQKNLFANLQVKVAVSGKLDAELNKVFNGLGQSVGSYKFML